MKVILIGYPGSQCIVKVSKYLTNKYLPQLDYGVAEYTPESSYFATIYLNYKGAINGWASFVAGYLTALTDKNIIFALDDYLIADYMDKAFDMEAAIKLVTGDTVCYKMCHCTPQEHEEYPVTTQWCIWDRKFLIWLLEQVSQPWEFEIKGSQIFKTTGKKVLQGPALKYFTNSSISARWEGVRLDGLSEEDIKYIKENNLIDGLK